METRNKETETLENQSKATTYKTSFTTSELDCVSVPYNKLKVV